MQERRTRMVVVAAILLLGGLWVVGGKRHKGAATQEPPAGTPAAMLAGSPAATGAQASGATGGAGRAPAGQSTAGEPAAAPAASSEEELASVPVPWAAKADENTPMVQWLKTHPSPHGERILASLKEDKAVVLTCIPSGTANEKKIRAWLTECSDYCERLANVIPVDPKEKSQAELLRYLKVDALQPPFFASIALSGEVKERLAGTLTRKKVIDLFAGVTGSCGVECENGCG